MSLDHVYFSGCETLPVQWVSTAEHSETSHFWKLILIKSLESLQKSSKGLLFLVKIFAILGDAKICNMHTINKYLKVQKHTLESLIKNLI